MLPRLYTVTDIAEEICRADDLRLGDHAIAHSQVRNAVRRGMLRDGKVIDKRGTRRGLPDEVADELATLKNYFETVLFPVPQTAWDEVAARGRKG